MVILIRNHDIPLLTTGEILWVTGKRALIKIMTWAFILRIKNKFHDKICNYKIQIKFAWKNTWNCMHVLLTHPSIIYTCVYVSRYISVHICMCIRLNEEDCKVSGNPVIMGHFRISSQHAKNTLVNIWWLKKQFKIFLRNNWSSVPLI